MTSQDLSAHAVVLQEPETLVLKELRLTPPNDADIVVDTEWSGISTGTERLLWNGRMPPFPGMGYPLVPGYESVGRVVSAGADSGQRVGDHVFVPGANCYGDIRGLFGGAASRIVVPGDRAITIDSGIGKDGVLFALAATAYHAFCNSGSSEMDLPDLIVGHGVLGRLLARLTLVLGGDAPVVWEKNATRQEGGAGYSVIDPDEDDRRDYTSIYDVSGDSSLLDTLIAHLAPRGRIVLAGFYEDRLNFEFPPAFVREVRMRVAAEWAPSDLAAVKEFVESGRLSLAGLITHRRDAQQAPAAYRTAFDDPSCLKMILDWRTCS